MPASREQILTSIDACVRQGSGYLLPGQTRILIAQHMSRVKKKADLRRPSLQSGCADYFRCLPIRPAISNMET